MRRISLLAVILAAALAAPAQAAPVKCAAGDPSPDGRIFAEANVSVAFMRFDEFQCGIKLLADT